jgi:hypothetical protein
MTISGLLGGEVATDFILTVDSPLNLPRLYERHHMLLNLVYSPTKRQTHPVQFNGCKWPEIQYHRPISDEICEIVYMWRKVNVNIMSCLQRHKLADQI